MQTLIVFSHLRWNFVYQRPQHVLSLLARHWHVVFIEEPVPQSAHDHVEEVSVEAGLTVWRPHLRGAEQGFHPNHRGALQSLIAQKVADGGISEYWLWFYTPSAFPVAAFMHPRGTIYDCMDELSAFRGAPPELLNDENALLQAADLVFTGGRSLYNAKRNRHHNVHCFPSSVDASHFRPGSAEHPLQCHIAGPRLGYCGVIDERLDLDLIAGIAERRPDWQIVMVGPTVKIDPALRPQQTNIHWLGSQPYGDLPAFINGWDVCLLPFALNESTRFISPTKTLEYMACGRPSVSTAIRDVVEPYGQVVPICADAAGFVAACDEILARSAAQQREHALALAHIVSLTSWDVTAEAMMEQIELVQIARNAEKNLQKHTTVHIVNHQQDAGTAPAAASPAALE